MGCRHQTPPLRNVYGRRGGKAEPEGVDTSEERVSSRQEGWYTFELMETATQTWTGSNWTKAQHWEGEVSTKSRP